MAKKHKPQPEPDPEPTKHTYTVQTPDGHYTVEAEYFAVEDGVIRFVVGEDAVAAFHASSFAITSEPETATPAETTNDE